MKRFATIILSLIVTVFSAAAAQEKNSLGMQLVTVPAGTFHMGSHGMGENFDEAPIHRVTITKPFLMAATEVTNAQYELFDPSHRALRGKNGISREDDEAVVFISYHDAEAFCRWLSEKEGKTYRLPTEAEWEYACRAGTYSNFWMDDGLPAAYHKNQQNVWGTDSTVSLRVGATPPNPFGLYDMHGNVEEWCSDWYGPYEPYEQTDPVGRVRGLYRVTRGGSHSTPERFLRSANRMAMLPEDKHHLTGFRVVQAEKPKSLPLPSLVDAKEEEVSQGTFAWSAPSDTPFFAEPLVYVHKPDCASGVPFYRHNHCPAVSWCDNGDLLAIWFTCDEESGREMTILESRLKAGTEVWTEPREFFRVPDRNVTGSSLLSHGDTLVHINGMEAAGTWETLAMVMRTSTDNGASWSRPRIIAPEHSRRHQVIAGAFLTCEGRMVQAADATPRSSGGTAFHLSCDGGTTWEDMGTPAPCTFAEGASGGTIAGIHAGIVQLSDGRFMALGRGDGIRNSDGIERMPMSISCDNGRTWTYHASEFPPIDGGQRLVLMRLREGPILLVSFTHHPFRIKDGQRGMTFRDAKGGEYTGYGMYAALSFDDGKTWPVKRLVTDGKTHFMDGGAWTGFFDMDATHAEPRGYLAATQSPDGIIHLLSSRNHYRFNLAWLLGGNTPEGKKNR